MASCQVQGEPGLYGLGIRVAFYIQWFGAIVVEYLEVADLPDMRLLGLLFSAAALIGLVVRLSAAALQPADVYIVLLLATGVYIFLVPLYAWKAVTCFRPYWDPFRWSSETPTPAFKGLNFALLLAVTSLAIWYWCAFVPENPCSSEQYGFLFSRISLGNKGFIASNAILYLVVLLACALILLLKIGCKVPYWRARRKKRRVSKTHIVAVKELKTLSDVAVAATLTAAVELAVSWNGITHANYVSDTAQVLPLLVSAGFLVRMLFLHFAAADGGSDSSEDESDYWASHSYMTESQGGLPPAPPPTHPRG